MTTIVLDAVGALTKRAEVEEIRAKPRAALIEELGARIKASSPAELVGPVERVVRTDRTAPDELVEVQRIALADPTAVWACFTSTATAEAIR